MEQYVSSATTAAEVRFSTLSLPKICSTCLQMVPVFAPRITPISWLLLPREIQKRTSATAVGTTALLLNTSGISNTAVGRGALVHNDTGSEKTAVGVTALP